MRLSTRAGGTGDAALWIARPGLADPSCVSFESKDRRGEFMRHVTARIYRQTAVGTAAFRAATTFCPMAGINGTGTSFAAYDEPSEFLRPFHGGVYLASYGGGYPWDDPASWADDVSWNVISSHA